VKSRPRMGVPESRILLLANRERNLTALAEIEVLSFARRWASSTIIRAAG
jgi:hypothetical protein